MAVAAALSGQLPPQLRRVGVILCGGNVDLDCLGWLTAAGELPRAPATDSQRDGDPEVGRQPLGGPENGDGPYHSQLRI